MVLVELGNFFILTDLKQRPGLVVMGGDSCSKGRGFESLHHILDWKFFIFIY